MIDLAELANELRTQDNAATAYPLYLVQQQRRIWGMDSRYTGMYRWCDREDFTISYAPHEILAALVDNDLENQLDGLAPHKIDPADHGYERVHYIDVWEFVTAHLTRRAAQRYIDENRHNLTAPRIYVSSQHRCTEWIALVAWLKEAQ